MKRAAVILFVGSIFLILLAVLPIPIPPYLDFQVMYHADMGLLRGISLYDRTGQVNMIAALAHVLPAQVFVLPFPYPPWYALVALPLALLPITVAARLWFGLNLLMLFAAIWLLTDGWESRRRLISFFVGLLFLPVLGSLIVGQYGFPVLLGAALLGFSLQHKKTLLTSFAFSLLTLKPHLGLVVLFASLLYLLRLHNDFSLRALKAILIAGGFLFAIGFLASPLWPADYLRSLLAFQSDAGVTSCNLCAATPVELVYLFKGTTVPHLTLIIALGLLLVLLFGLGLTRRQLVQFPKWLVALSILVTLLVSPYLLNYDFILLLFPFFLLMEGRHSSIGWLGLIVAYLMPLAILGFAGRQGNWVFSLSALILLFMVYCATRLLDVSQRQAYNPTTIE